MIIKFELFLSFYIRLIKNLPTKDAVGYAS